MARYAWRPPPSLPHKGGGALRCLGQDRATPPMEHPPPCGEGWGGGGGWPGSSVGGAAYSADGAKINTVELLHRPELLLAGRSRRLRATRCRELPRRPQHVALAIVAGHPTHHEEQVRETVEIGDGGGADVRLLRHQFDHLPLG